MKRLLIPLSLALLAVLVTRAFLSAVECLEHIGEDSTLDEEN